jgi:hypothetical protein
MLHELNDLLFRRVRATFVAAVVTFAVGVLSSGLAVASTVTATMTPEHFFGVDSCCGAMETTTVTVLADPANPVEYSSVSLFTQVCGGE